MSEISSTSVKPSTSRTGVTLLFLAGVVNFLDRSSLSIANGPIRADLHLSGTEIGALLSIFSLSYGIAQLPTGVLLDRFGTRLLLGMGLVFWSAAQLATGFVRNFSQFVPMRIALGVGEAPFFPGGVKAIHDQFAPEDRGWPMGLLNASTTLGQALAPPMLTVLLVRFGWRAMFIAIGALGLALACAWLPLFPRAATRPDRPPTHLAGAPAGRSAFSTWAALLRTRTMWGMLLGFGGINYSAWLYLAWLPGYLQIARHLTLAHTGWVAAVPFLSGSAGMFTSGSLADRIVRRGADPMRSRKALILSGMVASAACTALVPAAASTMAAVALVSAALFCIHFAGTAAWGLVQFASPAGQVATVGTIQNFGSFVVASAAPLITGWLLDRTHSFAAALSLAAGVTLAGAFAYFLLVRDAIEPLIET